MNSTVVGILVIVVIGIVGWLAYSQGYFQGSEAMQEDENANTGGLEIKIEGASDGEMMQ